MPMNKPLPLAIAATLSILSSHLNAIGIGQIKSENQLNRPLKIQLSLIGEVHDLHDLQVLLADASQHQRFGLSYPSWMPRLKYQLINTKSGPQLILTTHKVIKEPFVNFIISVKYKDTTVYKEITALLDPAKMVSTKTKKQITTEKKTSQTLPLASSRQPKFSTKYENSTSSAKTINTIIVKNGQSLWRVARAWKLSNVSQQQKMQAIFQENPNAFINGDRNRLKQGYKIRLTLNHLPYNTSKANTSKKAKVARKTVPNVKIIPSEVSQPTHRVNQNLQIKKNNYEIQIRQLQDKIKIQEMENRELRQKIIQVEKSINHQLSIRTEKTESNNIAPKNLTKKDSQNKIAAIQSKTLPVEDSKYNISANLTNSGLSKSNLWTTIFWLGGALTVAYIGAIHGGRRKARKFAHSLENKLQDIAYNSNREKDNTPSVKELSIPHNQSTSVQIKYLKSAADFYLRCQRFDLAKELINENLVQFAGNSKIVNALLKMRKKMFYQLDESLQSNIVEKLDARKDDDIENNNGVVIAANDEDTDMEKLQDEFKRKWSKKAS